MNKKEIILIAYQNQENLGVGYLSSMLLKHGFTTKTVDLNLEDKEICNKVGKTNPLIVGFSLIFQYYTNRIKELARQLRLRDIDCHFTVGGHYPSFCYEEILNNIPEIDSVVRFEGEQTVCDLAENLSINKDWQKVKSIAYRENGKPVSNDLRPLIRDLDTLPFPIRTEEKIFKCLGKRCSFILASRGCVWNCSFCSIRQFYGTPPGKLRRTRSPKNVVEEMKELFEKRGTQIFLFQDDDFIGPGRLGKEWVEDFIIQLETSQIADKILWKISCRCNDVEAELFSRQKQAGLGLVYLGIESGNPVGLKIMNKHLKVEDNLQAVSILKELDIFYEFGFMLFDPSSNFQSIRENINFMRKICGDGSTPATFCKMIPYAATDIESNLIKEGRLKGSIITPNYDFYEPQLNSFCDFLHKTFYEWMFTPKGFLAQLRWNQFEVAALEKFYPHAKGIREYKNFLKEFIASTNALFFQVAEKAVIIFQEDSMTKKTQLQNLIHLKEREVEKLKKLLRKEMIEFRDNN